MTIRVVLVDDQEMYRLGFHMLLESQDDVELVGEADDGTTAVELLAGVEADVVLMDVRMPRMDGIEATRRIVGGSGGGRTDGPAGGSGPRVLVLTTFDLDEYGLVALRAGASGFLLKDTGLEELMAAIRHVHDGDAVMAPSTTRRLIERFAARPTPAPDVESAPLDGLTSREGEVFLMLARGFPNDRIARELSIAEGTVRIHVGRILGKLGLHDRSQAVVLAYESGLIRPGER